MALVASKYQEKPWHDVRYLLRGRIMAMKDGQTEKDHPVTEDEIAGLCQRQFSYAESYLWLMNSKILEDFLWFAGRHDLRYDTSSRSFHQVDAARKLRRPSINLCMDQVEGTCGELMRGILEGKVLPNSSSYRDVSGARAAEAIRRFIDEANKMPRKIRSFLHTMVTAGDAFFYSENDASTDSEVTYSFAGDNGNSRDVSLNLADVNTVCLLPGVQIFPDYNATDEDDAEWHHIYVINTTGMIKEQYRHLRDLISGDLAGSPASLWQQRIHELLTQELGPSYLMGMAGSYGYSTAEQHDLTLTHTILMKPSRYYPRGRIFIVAGRRLAWAGELPNGRVNIVHGRYAPIENSYWSLGQVSQIRPMNKHTEANFAIASLARRISAVPMIWTPRQGEGPFSKGDLKVKVGGIYDYKPDEVTRKGPELVQGRHPADSGFVAEAELTLNLLERVSGRRGVLAGDRPQGITAGIALQFLASRASVRFVQVQDGVNVNIEEVTVQRLRCVRDAPAWQLPRTISIPGNAGQYGFRVFSASDMADNFNYKIVTQGRHIQDEAILAQTVQDALKLQIIDPMISENRRIARRVMGLEDLGFEDGDSDDVEFAKLQLHRLLEGNDITLYGFEDLKTMLLITLKHLKSQRFLDDTPVNQRKVLDFLTMLRQANAVARMGAMSESAMLDEQSSAFAAATRDPGLPRPPAGLLGPGGEGGGAAGGAPPRAAAPSGAPGGGGAPAAPPA